MRKLIALLVYAAASCFLGAQVVDQSLLRGLTGSVQSQLNAKALISGTNVLSANLLYDGALTNEIEFDDIARLTLDSTDGQFTGVATLYLDGGITTLRGVTNLHVVTPAITAGTATVGHVLQLTDPLTGEVEYRQPLHDSPFDTITTGSPLYVFGDSQSFGVNAATTNYTSGGNLLEHYRPFALVATNGSRAMPLTNYAIGGSRIGNVPNSATFSDRANPFNRIGRWLNSSWSGVATLMIGYNDFLYVDADFDLFYARAQEATIARLFLSGWVNDGVTHEGVSYTSWSSGGTSTSGSYADLNPFPRGNPGTDVTKWTVLDNTDTITLTLTNAAKAVVFWETTSAGGLVDVFTNGTIVRRIQGGYAHTGASTQENIPQSLVFDANASGSTSVTISNVSGVNYILSVGFLPSTPPSGRKVIVGNIVPRIKDGETGPWDVERRMGYQTAAAALKWKGWPVWYADVFSRMDTNTHYQVGDESHQTPAGAAAIAEAFNNPVKASELLEPLLGGTGIVGEAAVNGQRVSYVNAPTGAASQRQWRRGNMTRWSLDNSSATESGSNAGSLFELYGYTDAGAQNRLMMRAYRDQDLIQWPTLMELGDRSDSATVVRIVGAAGSTRDLIWGTGSSSRWIWRVTSASESGSNAGSDLQLIARDDSGALLSTPLSFTRSSGAISISGNSTFTGTVALNGTSTAVGDGTVAVGLSMRGGQNQTKDLQFQTGSTNRWIIRSAANTESGSNAGSTFQILRRADDGTAIDAPFQISRETGNLTLGDSGSGVKRIKHGFVSLVAGTATVSESTVTSSSRIMLTTQSPGGTPGWVHVSARTDGVSFTVLSSSGSDTSIVAWVIIEP